ncbi:spore germination protein [Bacillus taeanensis]|uniref:Spore germination protein n=1 Tax=Bacillus taeanensis TaxID=273032 RepID=A0A366Y1T0_9BACI|nr:spore germination protein [Bacillus taeanensis]RBW70363.1 spore germination protein [Bacillus taeanensis]
MVQQAEKEKIETQKNIYAKLKENNAYLKDRLGIGISFDIGFRELKIAHKDIALYYLTGLCDTNLILEIVKVFDELNHNSRSVSGLKKVLYNNIPHQQVETTDKLDEAVDKLLSGLIVIFIDGDTEALIVDVRSYPGRTPQEPDTEKVVRGARDGYTENIIENTAMTRRRIRDERLRYEMIQVGERSKTDICIAYIQDVADPGLVDLMKKELNKIDIDGIPMADKTIEEFIVKQGWNPFPMVRYTERPDVAATHLFEGHVLIMVDTSPSVMITPTTYFHHVQHAEEYRQTPAIGVFVRWIRFAGMIASIFLLPLWYLFVSEPNLLPANLEFIGPNEKNMNIPIILQILFAELGIDILRMAAIHTPTPLSTAMGLIAAVLIGQIAIDVGLFVPEVILYIAVAAIGNFATPSYELGVANKLIRLLLLLLVLAFEVQGFMIGATAIILFLATIKNINTPYLWPFLPFDPKAFLQIIIRVSVPLSKLRPSIVHPQNQKKQSS